MHLKEAEYVLAIERHRTIYRAAEELGITQPSLSRFLQGDVYKRQAQKACEMIEDGDTIFINSSSTAMLIFQYLANKSVTIITNNGRSLLMQRDPMVELVLTGGEVYGKKRSLVGEFALNALNKVCLLYTSRCV